MNYLAMCKLYCLQPDTKQEEVFSESEDEDPGTEQVKEITLKAEKSYMFEVCKTGYLFSVPCIICNVCTIKN